MKKIIKITAAITSFLFFAVLIAPPASAQSTQKSPGDNSTIPSDVMKIVDKSCAACHKEPGKKMAIGLLNLSAWNKYTPEKQASKAKAVCNEVTKSKMPPKSYVTSNPVAALTSDDIKTFCNWATSLQTVKK